MPPFPRQSIDRCLHAGAHLAAQTPWGRRLRRRIGAKQTLAYGPGAGAEHLVDVLWPAQPASGLLPVVVYVHGGGFGLGSRDSHWHAGAAFAAAGCLTLVTNYRLAPAAPYPAALADLCRLWGFLLTNVEGWGGDRQRIFLAGESAGANLIAALTWALCAPRSEPFAAAAFAAGVVPRGILPACGLLSLGVARPPQPGYWARLVTWRLAAIEIRYLGAPAQPVPELASPLQLYAEAPAAALKRPLPPFFIQVGDRDPILADSLALHAALRRRGVTSRLQIYPAAGHAFHLLPWQRQAAAAWLDAVGFVQTPPD